MYYTPIFCPIHWCQKPAAGRDQVTPLGSKLANQVVRSDTMTVREAITKLSPTEQAFMGMYVMIRASQFIRKGLVSDQIFSSMPGDTK